VTGKSTTMFVVNYYRIILLGAAVFVQVGCTDPSDSPADFNESCFADGAFKVLVFTKTLGYRHASIEKGVSTICDLAIENNFSIFHTEDSEWFKTESLNQFDLVVFLNTSGDILNVEQQAAFEMFIRNGGGFVGIHSASDTEYDWQWYAGMIGAYFESHPVIQTATINIEDNSHPSTKHLMGAWIRSDEWYNFRNNPRQNVNVLLSLDESTYIGGNMLSDHPIAWYHDYDGGRAWYTAMGHTVTSYDEPMFQKHLLGGILWAAGK
jgi:type 1 glutamine amidotransferase